jgi:hypothetical protein
MTKLQLKALAMAKDEIYALRQQKYKLQDHIKTITAQIASLRNLKPKLYAELAPLHGALLDIPSYLPEDEAVTWIDLATSEV